mgnify:CR=1 FL=1
MVIVMELAIQSRNCVLQYSLSSVYINERGIMLEISIEGTNDFSLCRPSGEIDAYTVDQFRDALSSLATVSKLLIDLSDVPFMDSAGLGALIGSIRKAGENDGQIVVSCGRESLLGLLKTTGFDQIVTVTESVNEALDVLGESQDR